MRQGITSMEAVATARVGDQDLQASRLALRALAQKELERGNPFPMIRYEWPNLIIRDPMDQEAFRKFCKRQDNLDLRLDDFQIDMIRSVFDLKHVQLFMAGGTKMGKGFVTGYIICNLWWNLFPKCKIILIGPTTTHLQDNLFAEVVAGRRDMTSFKNGLVVCDVQKERLSDPENQDHFLKLANTSSGESLSGSHSVATLYVYDEASGCPEGYYTEALSQAAMLVAISNPRAPSGWFFHGFPADFDSGAKTIISDMGPRRIIAAGAVDCINVRANRLSKLIAPACGIDILGRHFDSGQVIPIELKPHVRELIPGQVCKRLCEALKLLKDQAQVGFRVYGRFPRDGSLFQVFAPSWRPRSVELRQKFLENSRLTAAAAGIDPSGSSSGDPCVIALGNVLGVRAIIEIQDPNLTTLRHQIYRECESYGVDLRDGGIPVAIDCIGLGHNMADEMESEGVWIVRIDARKKPESESEEFSNRRAEFYGQLAEMLNPKYIGEEPWGLPDCDLLWQELYALEKIYLPDARGYSLNPKRRAEGQKPQKIADNRQSIEEKIGRSPDRSDAVAYLGQAVRLLPEWLDHNEGQFDPQNELKSYEPLGRDQVRVVFWNGKSLDFSKAEFLSLYGENPECFGAMNFGETNHSMR